MQTATNIPQGLQLPMFGDSIAQRFAEFNRENPTVYLLFEKFAKQLIEEFGFKKIGAKMIVERVRWECITNSKDKQGYKINNNYTAHYARLFIQKNPQYRNCFETRELKAA